MIIQRRLKFFLQITGSLCFIRVICGNGKNNHFRTDKDLEIGNGYWVNSLETEFIPTKGNPPELLDDIFLKKGWNLVGIKGDEAISFPSGFETSGKVWFWDGEHQQLMPIDSEELPANQRNKLIPGYGYWIYASDDPSKPMSEP